MAEERPSPHGLAALALSTSLLQVLLKHGVIDDATVASIVKEAGLYAQALCTDCSPEVERETLRIVKLIKSEAAVPAVDSATEEATGPSQRRRDQEPADPDNNGG